MTSFYAQLTGEALLHLRGPDSLTFLQGQTTCDTSLVDASRSAAGVYCTAQGRVVCDFVLTQLGHEHVALRMRRNIRARAAEVFGKYVIFSKAEFDAQNDDWQCFAFWGERVAQDLHACFGDCPSEKFAKVGGDGFALVQTDTARTQFECYLRQGSDYSASFTKTLQKAEESTWRKQQITKGIARIEPSTQEKFVPQVLNYDLIDHISFTKGCYTGQEVIARLHYRGTPKRRTFLAHMPAAAQVADSVYVADNPQSVGDIINIESGKPAVALVSATRSGAEQGLRLHAPDGPAISLQALPYALDPSED